MELTVEAYLADPSGADEALKRNWDQIPLLDSVPNHQLVDGGLYRFSGMIQDIPNPVYYYQNYSVSNTLTGETTIRCGKYRDGLVCHENEKLLLDADGSVNAERRVYYCVNVPALNAWARLSPQVAKNQSPTTTNEAKRPANMEVDVEESSDGSNKRQCVNFSRSSQPSTMTRLHCPITSPHDGACVVHVYDSPDADDSLKVNVVVDVVGFVYVSCTDQDEVDVPPSLAPRLHALAIRPYVNPTAETVPDVVSLRADLHLALTQLLLGDHLAADYVICHLLSTVYGREVAVLGKYSLNLFNIPLDPAYIQGVYDILSLLIPKSHLFPMTLENMNTTDLEPMKDYETNRLKSGMLQLSDRTHLVIDETKLQPGKLGERGVKNVHVLNTLLSEQVVNFDFKYYSIPFPMNIPVLVLSEGKSLLQCDTVLKLIPAESGSSTSETIDAVKTFLKEPLLSNVRAYLAAMATQRFTLPEDLTQAVQDDFVAMRQSDAKITPEEMHAHLVLARLLSLSVGRTTMTKEVWDKATELERQRRARLPK